MCSYSGFFQAKGESHAAQSLPNPPPVHINITSCQKVSQTPGAWIHKSYPTNRVTPASTLLHEAISTLPDVRTLSSRATGTLTHCALDKCLVGRAARGTHTHTHTHTPIPPQEDVHERLSRDVRAPHPRAADGHRPHPSLLMEPIVHHF
jgi:hypothetical protein